MTNEELRDLASKSLDYAREQLVKHGKLLPQLLVLDQEGDVHVYLMDTPGARFRDVVRAVLNDFKQPPVIFSSIVEAWTVTVAAKTKTTDAQEALKEARKQIPADLSTAPDRQECLMVCTTSYDHTIVETQVFKRSTGGLFAFEEILTQETGTAFSPMGDLTELRKLLVKPQ